MRRGRGKSWTEIQEGVGAGGLDVLKVRCSLNAGHVKAGQGQRLGIKQVQVDDSIIRKPSFGTVKRKPKVELQHLFIWRFFDIDMLQQHQYPRLDLLGLTCGTRWWEPARIEV
jgi:hypothetical protein